jgi:carboxyl-terminal processing protease
VKGKMPDLRNVAQTSVCDVRTRSQTKVCATCWLPGLIFAFFLFPFAFAAGDSGAVSTSTREGRLAVFDDVWQTVRDRYYDANFHGVDWLTQREGFRSTAADARGPRELYAVLRRMLALLQDAHTRVYAPEEKFDWQHPRFVSIGVSLREVEGQPTVVAVDRGSESERAGVRPGDVIESIDGELASSVIARKLREGMGYSTPQAARNRAVGFLLEGPANTNVQVGWRTIDNKERLASFRREWHQRDYFLLMNQRGNRAVVEFDVFTLAMTRDFARALKGKLRHVRGLVLDLRNNGGGDAEAMAGIASYFLPAATRIGEFTNRSGNVALSLEAETLSLLGADRIAPTEVPLIILTSDRTSSAAEILVAALKEAQRAIVIGGETCGCVLAIRTRHNLPDGGELDVSELDYRTAKGARLEGRGIVPDESISLRRGDLYSRRDRVLELALARLKDLSRNRATKSKDGSADGGSPPSLHSASSRMGFARR